MKKYIVTCTILFLLSINCEASHVEAQRVSAVKNNIEQISIKTVALFDTSLALKNISYIQYDGTKLSDERFRISKLESKCLASGFECQLDLITLNPSNRNRTCSVVVQLESLFGDVIFSEQIAWGNCISQKPKRPIINLNAESLVLKEVGKDFFSLLSNYQLEVSVANDSNYKFEGYVENLFIAYGKNGEVLDSQIVSLQTIESGSFYELKSIVLRPSLWAKMCKVDFFLDSANLVSEINERDNKISREIGDCNSTSVDFDSDPTLKLTRSLNGMLVIRYSNLGSKDLNTTIPMLIETFTENRIQLKQFMISSKNEVKSFGETEIMSFPISVEECFFRVSVDPDWKILDENRDNNIQILNLCNN